MEIIYVIGTVALFAALIYGTTQYRTRKTAIDRKADEIVADRYKRNDN